MDRTREIKKILKLNRLIPIQDLNKEQKDLLEQKYLLKHYPVFPKDNWYIIVTPENRQYIQKWVESKGKSRAYNVGAYYGIVKKELYTNLSMPPNCVEVSLEEFIRNFVL